MSKSLGNVVRIRDALKEYSAQELRWYFAGFHYREPVVMSTSALRRARDEFRLLSKNMGNFRKRPIGKDSSESKRLKQLTIKVEKDFRKCMDDDFDTPGALKALTNYAANLSKLAERQKISARSKRKAEGIFQRIFQVIGITV